MKLYISLSRFVLFSVAWAFGVIAVEAATNSKYQNGVITFTERLTDGREISDYEGVEFVGLLNDIPDAVFEVPYGGAIYSRYNSYIFRDNARITFCRNSVSEGVGGAIYNIGQVEMKGNVLIDFCHNIASGADDYSSTYGGAIGNLGLLALNGNTRIAFSDNSAGNGGGISSSYSLEMRENDSVSFVDNRAVGSGGAILNGGEIALLDLSCNGTVDFCGNYASVGGAIYNYDTFTLSSNGSVYFADNAAVAHGGAIWNNGFFTLNDNDEVSFYNNRTGQTDKLYNTHYWGGAICSEGGAFIVSENGNVNFVGNSVYNGYGGAIYSSSSFEIKDNSCVSFCSNSVSCGSGGAIYHVWDWGTMESNEYIVFNDNSVSNGSGGAIYANVRSSMSNNGTVSFCRNIASLTELNSYFCGGVSGGAIFNSGEMRFENNRVLAFSENKVSCNLENLYYDGGYVSAYGGAIHNDNGVGDFTISENGCVLFEGNSASVRAALSHTDAYGGAIYNVCFTNISLRKNESLEFRGNSARIYHRDGNNGSGRSVGGAIYNQEYARFEVCDNGNVLFTDNSTLSDCENGNFDSLGGAIYNGDGVAFTMCANADVEICGNSAKATEGNVYGGAIYNDFGSVFRLSENGAVTIIGNVAQSLNFAALGGSIYNLGSLNISGNAGVIFQKNVEMEGDGGYRLRSIYSESGTMNLSAPEKKEIMFKDSVYASGTVNLNQDYTDSESVEHKSMGDIIFTGATTEADLREVKGGVDGTVEEILNSRTSEIATNVQLYGGRLIVEDGAILKGQGITVTKVANATIRLNSGTLDETGYEIAVSSGSGLEFEGENVLKAASVQMADGAFLSFVMGEGNGTNWDAQLITGPLNLKVSGDLFNEHCLLTLSDASQYDTSRWTSDAVTVTGAGFDSLSWADGVLTYTPHVITPDADGSIDEALPEDGNAIIDGKGHALTVKNEVQLVQMALKNGTVKLEGENNGIVSVTLTEGGELVLTAGAGLKTGDIISMVASGKGELVISGDITIDNKGMKGKKGELASLSHADAQVLGDASISNVRVEDSTIDLAEGSTVGFEHVVLAATTRITDDPATANLDDVTAELVMGVNASLTGSDILMAGTSLEQSGNPGVTLTLSDDASVLMLEATTFDSLTLSGSTLVLELAGMTLEMFDNAELIAVSFTSGKDYATFDKSLAVTLSVDGINYERGYTMEADDTPTTMYFRGGKKPAPATPEPATATLSLLALAALVARRRRR